MNTGRLTNYNHTIYASYAAYICQAIVNNFAPLLFLTFQAEFSLSLQSITLITTVNFLVQLGVDLLSARFVDRIGYRICLVMAHVFAAAGLAGMSVLPDLMDPYAGILTCVVLYAVGGGVIEVLISPVVEACPTEKKEAAMSLLHSFYCWGHMAVVLVSTGFFGIAGISSWRVLAAVWALVPACNAVYFAKVPLYPIVGEQEKLPVQRLLGQRVFWLLILMMVCAGASEQAVSQWVSAFAESALHISKRMGDLLGVCAFAVMMGTSRALYGKHSDRIPLKKMMVFSAVLCIACYLLAAFSEAPVFGLLGCALCGFSVGIFWPGTFSMAALALPGGGTAMYALMALAGDLGCASGPTLVGTAAGWLGGDLRKGIALAAVFPVLMLLGIARIQKRKRTQRDERLR